MRRSVDLLPMKNQQEESENSRTTRLKSIMASSQSLQHDLDKVKGQLLDILQENQKCVQTQSLRGPVLGVSGAAMQRKYNLRIRNGRNKDCGSPYPGHLVSITPHPPVREDGISCTEGLISSTVQRTVASYAFPSGQETPSPPRCGKRQTKSLCPKIRRRTIQVNVDDTLAHDELTDISVDVDLMCTPRGLDPKPYQSKSLHDISDISHSKPDQPKPLHDISGISRSSRTNLHEEVSSNESRLLRNAPALHSTFNYPLHSTMNYPLHSTMAQSDISIEAVDCMDKHGGTCTETLKTTSSCCLSSCDFSRSTCLECSADVLQPLAPGHRAWTDVKGLASRLMPLIADKGGLLRRQTGQIHLSEPRSPVKLSDTDFLSATVLEDASMDGTRLYAPQIQVPSSGASPKEHNLRTNHVPSRQPSGNERSPPEGSETSGPQSFAMCQLQRVSEKTNGRKTCYATAASCFTGNNTYENIATRSKRHDCAKLSSLKKTATKRRSGHNKENQTPVKVPRVSITPAGPSSGPGAHGETIHPSDIDSVLSAHPGCFNLIKSVKTKKSSSRKDKVGDYDQMKRKVLAGKMKQFQRTLSGIGDRDREVTLLGQL